MKPLAIDLYCGLGGWTEGLLDEGYEVIGFDIERHVYGDERYPAQLVLQDVLTIDGAAFKDAALIVASPPCQAYSYRAMPWKRAKALPPPSNELFDACFRIQREACEAAGRHVPMVVENVRGAQPWVGRAKWHYGSFYLWGDVPALMPMTKPRAKVPGLGAGWRPPGHPDHRPGVAFNTTAEKHTKNNGGSWFNIGSPGQKVVNMNPTRRTNVGSGNRFTSIERSERDGLKCGGDWFNADETSIMRRQSSKSSARKRASALIAKIPLRLSRWIAATYYPSKRREAAL